jgi:hypothetical protein
VTTGVHVPELLLAIALVAIAAGAAVPFAHGSVDRMRSGSRGPVCCGPAGERPVRGGQALGLIAKSGSPKTPPVLAAHVCRRQQ